MTTSPLKVLVVDDELAIRRALRPTLTGLGCTVTDASRGEEAVYMLRAKQFDVVLLDVNMPGIGGIETLRRVRAFNARIPIVMVTVRDGEDDMVRALDLGADDYITKPFRTGELMARVRSATRRNRSHEMPEDLAVSIGELRLCPATRSVIKREEEIKLTPKEYKILRYLMLNAGKVVSHARLLSEVWGPHAIDEVKYLRTFMRVLRRKICDDPSNPVYLLTDSHVGYRFCECVPGEGAHVEA